MSRYMPQRVTALAGIILIQAFVCYPIGANAAPGYTVRPSVDPQVNKAIWQARVSVGTFIKALSLPGVSGASVKVDLIQPNGGQHERIWITDVRYSRGVFHGVVPESERPVLVTSVKVGDAIDVPATKILDWMYYTDQGKLRGSYTTLAMYPKLKPDEQAAIRNRTGLTDAELRVQAR